MGIGDLLQSHVDTQAEDAARYRWVRTHPALMVHYLTKLFDAAGAFGVVAPEDIDKQVDTRGGSTSDGEVGK